MYKIIKLVYEKWTLQQHLLNKTDHQLVIRSLIMYGMEIKYKNMIRPHTWFIILLYLGLTKDQHFYTVFRMMKNSTYEINLIFINKLWKWYLSI